MFAVTSWEVINVISLCYVQLRVEDSLKLYRSIFMREIEQYVRQFSSTLLK